MVNEVNVSSVDLVVFVVYLLREMSKVVSLVLSVVL